MEIGDVHLVMVEDSNRAYRVVSIADLRAANITVTHRHQHPLGTAMKDTLGPLLQPQRLWLLSPLFDLSTPLA